MFFLVDNFQKLERFIKLKLLFVVGDKMKVVVNGFGRIGRVFFREALSRGVNVVAINDLVSVDELIYLLKYDSVYGKFGKDVEAGENFIKVGGKKIMVFGERDPENLPWGKMGVDVVIESSGVFRDKEGASKHLKAGAKKVLISAPSKDADCMIVMGVNDKYLKKSDKIISLASCTTNCIAPIVKVLNDKCGITKGYMTTVHAYTNTQNILDSAHKKVRRSRAGAINLIPTSTGATSATGVVIPEVKGKLDGISVRAPVPCGSVVDLVCTLRKKVSVDEVNKAIKVAANGKMKGILEYTEEEIVSSDIIGDSHSSIFDSKLTFANGNMIKVFSWYDNEYGYSCRLVDFLSRLK
jgi:glyceraldehyde 3-phosphate dehydrogenase